MIGKKLNELKKMLIEEASLVEDMVKNSIKGFLNKDEELLKKIINTNEPEINDFELNIEEACINLIALYQPKASILRTIVMILKINNDLERIGDIAVNISESAIFLMKRPPVKPLIDIPRMAEEAQGMLKDAIDAFMAGDSDLAKSVCRRDEVVDNLRDQVLRELITYMMSDPSTIERAIHLIRISRNLERVADLSTNIAEDVIFIVEGRTVRHRRGIGHDE